VRFPIIPGGADLSRTRTGLDSQGYDFSKPHLPNEAGSHGNRPRQAQTHLSTGSSTMHKGASGDSWPTNTVYRNVSSVPDWGRDLSEDCVDYSRGNVQRSLHRGAGQSPSPSTSRNSVPVVRYVPESSSSLHHDDLDLEHRDDLDLEHQDDLALELGANMTVDSTEHGSDVAVMDRRETGDPSAAVAAMQYDIAFENVSEDSDPQNGREVDDSVHAEDVHGSSLDFTSYVRSSHKMTEIAGQRAGIDSPQMGGDVSSLKIKNEPACEADFRDYRQNLHLQGMLESHTSGLHVSASHSSVSHTSGSHTPSSLSMPSLPVLFPSQSASSPSLVSSGHVPLGVPLPAVQSLLSLRHSSDTPSHRKKARKAAYFPSELSLADPSLTLTGTAGRRLEIDHGLQIDRDLQIHVDRRLDTNRSVDLESAGGGGFTAEGHHSPSPVLSPTAVFDSRRQCDVCQRVFRSVTDCQRHQRIHTGEKPYKCDLCPRAFTLKHHLQLHVRIHTGERPYECGTCGKHFVSSSDLKRHGHSCLDETLL
jgi:hypothetical protein